MVKETNKTAPIVKRFQRIAATTVGAVVFLILVGALVRMTGSGMGCPDWPQCFGQWIPPTDISQLPADYKTRFEVAGKEIADFDAFKTWVEYVNRLIGVLIGFLSILTALFAWPIRKLHPTSWRFSLAGLVMVIVQGGIGAYVVRTNLHTGMISLHMVIALLILGVFMWAWLSSYQRFFAQIAASVSNISSSILNIGILTLVLMMTQIILGTQVREAVDEIAKAMGEATRSSWVAQLGQSYGIHKYFYYAVVISLGFWLYQGRNIIKQIQVLQWTSMTMLSCLGATIILGLSMHHLGMPAWMQPAHLLLATVLIASAFAHFSILMRIHWILKAESENPPQKSLPLQSEILS
ncbi:MAG: COX15/CtaA family protein [Bacteroidota bacterium]